MSGCKENQGVHKGTFEQDCAVKNGALSRTSANEYACTLPDGTVLKTPNPKSNL